MFAALRPAPLRLSGGNRCEFLARPGDRRGDETRCRRPGRCGADVPPRPDLRNPARPEDCRFQLLRLLADGGAASFRE